MKGVSVYMAVIFNVAYGLKTKSELVVSDLTEEGKDEINVDALEVTDLEVTQDLEDGKTNESERNAERIQAWGADGDETKNDDMEEKV